MIKYACILGGEGLSIHQNLKGIPNHKVMFTRVYQKSSTNSWLLKFTEHFKVA